MQKLLLIRHAKSDWENGLIPDIQRPLNERGYRDANNMSLRLKENNVFPDLIVSSPAIRAYSTALIFSLNLGYSFDKILLCSELYESSISKYTQAISKINSSYKNVFIFGHNPIISSTASKLSNDFTDEMPTCGIVVIDKSTKNWADFITAPTKNLLFDFPKKIAS